MKTLQVTSQRQVELIDITQHVSDLVDSLMITDGLVTVFTPHTTAAITINENADPDVCRDLVMGINKLVAQHDHYRHIEGNSAAHIKSSLFGASETLILDGGRLVLGTWQGIYFCEFDGPRQRQVHITVIAA